MRDLGVLKERIEHAERHLKAAHSARERESEALMAMWTQIRDRFETQEKEIARYREEVETLIRVNDELSALVDRLISTVEGSVDMSKNETVPEVSRLADGLLKSEPKAPEFAAPTMAEEAASLDALETDDPLDLGTPLDEPAVTSSVNFGDLLNEAMAADDGLDMPEPTPGPADDEIDMPEPVQEESVSSGIRDLIARIEGSVGKNAADDDDENELRRELREIESLRSQLSGLHDKISRTG